MAANTSPIFTGRPDIQWSIADGNGGSAGPLKTANTALDGTGTVTTVFTADATNGGFVRFLRARLIGSNSASVLRIFINNGSTNATSANNTLIDEVSLPTTTASNSQAQCPIDIALGFAMDPGYVINCTVGTSLTGGVQLTVFGGKY